MHIFLSRSSHNMIVSNPIHFSINGAVLLCLQLRVYHVFLTQSFLGDWLVLGLVHMLHKESLRSTGEWYAQWDIIVIFCLLRNSCTYLHNFILTLYKGSFSPTSATYIFILHFNFLCEVFACLYVCALHVCSASRGQKRAPYPTGLEL